MRLTTSSRLRVASSGVELISVRHGRHHMRQVGNKIKCEPVGRCIYCGETEGLTMEHVAPFSLGGRMEMPDSSCKKCACITGKFEGVVAGSMLLAARTKFKAPTRRPRERPTHLRLKVIKGTETEDTLVPAEDHPGTFILPILSEPPRYLTDLAGLHSVPSTMSFTTFSVSELGRLMPAGADAFLVGEFVQLPFFRMIAKMAHAYATAYRGYGNFNPILLPFILGKEEIWIDFIGDGPAYFDVNAGNFSFRTFSTVVGSTTYLGCEVTLFPNWGGPTYQVVVGTL